MLRQLEIPPVPGGAHSFGRFSTLSWPSLGLVASTCFFAADVVEDTLFGHFGIPLEREILTAVPTRRAEYLAGRLCASRALARIGVTGHVGVGRDRCPIWPRGTVGSISHCAGHAIAVALPANASAGVGLDIEGRDAFDEASPATDLFMTDAERSVLRNASVPEADHAILVFSAKESFFKAAYPQVRRYFDFFAVELTEVDTHTRSITLKVTSDLSSRVRVGRRVPGAFNHLDGRLFATAVRMRAPRSCAHLPDQQLADAR